MKLRLGSLFKTSARCSCCWSSPACWRPCLHRRPVWPPPAGLPRRALGRRVEIGKVHFNLFKGPGFSVDNVTIYEDPAIGMEPVVYIQEPGSMEVVPSIWSLLGGKFRDRLHTPRWRQHHAHQIGSGVGVGPLEFRVDRQSFGDSHRARHPRARQPHSLQIRRHQERLLPHRDRSRRFSVRSRRRLEGRLFRQARAHRPRRRKAWDRFA